jgi:hypothetical protein
VLRFARPGEHDDRDGGQHPVVLDLPQHLEAIHARQVQVQQDERGPRRAGVRSFAAKERGSVDAIVRDV